MKYNLTQYTPFIVVNCARVDRKMMKQLFAKQNTFYFMRVVSKINLR